MNEREANRYVLAVVLVLVLAIVAVLAFNALRGSPQQPPSSKLESTTGGGLASPSATHASATGPASPPTTATRSQLERVAKQVVIVAAATPVTANTIASLRAPHALITDEFAQQLQQLSNGPIPAGSSVKVTSVIFDNDATTITADTAQLEARVAKKITTPSSTSVVFPTVIISLVQTGGAWLVNDIQEF